MISVRAFWTALSRDQYRIGPVEGLSLALSYRVLFDQLFGSLARHSFERVERDGALLRCTGCRNPLRAEENDVCETHVGILAGQLERHFGVAYDAVRCPTQDGCTLRFAPSEPPRR